MRKYSLLPMLFVVTMTLVGVSCSNHKTNSTDQPSGDHTAKKMLQGLWLNEDDDSPAFRVVGDTIFYPDSTFTTCVLSNNKRLTYSSQFECC